MNIEYLLILFLLICDQQLDIIRKEKILFLQIFIYVETKARHYEQHNSSSKY